MTDKSEEESSKQSDESEDAGTAWTEDKSEKTGLKSLDHSGTWGSRKIGST